MKTTTKIILFTIVLTSILLSLGYAAIQNVTLNITGNVTADPNQSNFKVRFVRDVEPTVSDSVYATAGVTDDLNAVLNVNGLNAKGQTIEAIYEIENISSDLSSDLSISVTNSNTEYFKVTSQLAATSLKAGEKTTVTVIVELIKTPLQSVSSTIGIETIAAPVQPGEEGSSGITNDYSQVPEEKSILYSVAPNNIGEYINIGNNVIGTVSTEDDWRILYKDDNYVYAILADCLPASLVPTLAGLNTNIERYTYSVWSDTNKETLLNGLLNEEAWGGFANGIIGARVTGAPTLEQLINSYNIKNETNLTFDTATDLVGDLYSPNSTVSMNNSGYWIATPIEYEPDSLIVLQIEFSNLGWGACSMYNAIDISARPVIAIPLDTQCEYENNVWKILE